MRPLTAAEIEARYWSFVVKGDEPDDCWGWTGPLTENRYGYFEFGRGKRALAHRYSFKLHHGEANSPVVRHTCDVKRCSNPLHLIPGTHKDNSQDAVERGLMVRHRGSTNGMASLTEDQAQAIRILSLRGDRHTAIARRFGVSPAAISLIVWHKTWTHLT